MILRGITTSEAHYWAHVCPSDGGIYAYPRRWMVSIHKRLPERRIASAIGRLAPLPKILQVNRGRAWFVYLGYERMARYDFQGAPSDRAAGELAERCFVEACDDGLFMLPIKTRRYHDLGSQYAGKDYACCLESKVVDVEVKADVIGGHWGTGNLFVQTHEGTTADGDRHDFAGRNAHV